MDLDDLLAEVDNVINDKTDIKYFIYFLDQKKAIIIIITII